MSFHLLGTLVGGIVAVAFVGWWFHARRTARSTLWVAIGVCVAFFVFIGVVFARFVDRSAHPEELSPELVQALGTNASLVTAFYRYDRGGFIDHEWLWRIDATPEATTLVVSGLGLRSTKSVPRDFWRSRRTIGHAPCPLAERYFRVRCFQETAEDRMVRTISWFTTRHTAERLYG
jgi:hypothetical protein